MPAYIHQSDEGGASMKHTWGGKRVAGPGKKLGPPFKNERLVQIQAKVAPEVKTWYQTEAERCKVSVSALVALALKEWAGAAQLTNSETAIPAFVKSNLQAAKA